MTTPTKFAPAALLAQQAVQQMTPGQFDAYERALRATDYTQLSTTDLENFTAALRATNERRSALNVTVRDGNAPMRDVLSQIPTWGWVAIGAGAIALVLASTR